MLHLYLIRHPSAVEGIWPDDADRPLSPKGMARLHREVSALAALDVTFDQIVTSPLACSRQTAEILATDLPGDAPEIAVCEALAPGGSVDAVLDELARHTGRSRIALIGHVDGLGALAAHLIGARAPLAFKKGAICRIDVEVLPLATPGTLRWFATPRMLRWIRRGEHPHVHPAETCLEAAHSHEP